MNDAFWDGCYAVGLVKGDNGELVRQGSREDAAYIPVPEEDYPSLSVFFNELNEELGIIIDYCEEEFIESDQLAAAMCVLIRWEGKPDLSKPQQEGLARFREALELAMENETFMEIAF